MMSPAAAAKPPRMTARRRGDVVIRALHWRFEDQVAVWAALLGLAVIGSAVAGTMGLGTPLSPGSKDWHELALALEAASLFGAAAAIALLWLGARRLSADLRRFATMANKIGRDPSINTLPWLEGSREFLDLSASLRSLLRRVGFAEWNAVGTQDALAQDSLTQNALSQEVLTQEALLQGVLAGAEATGRRFSPRHELQCHIAPNDQLTGLLDRNAFLLFAEDAIPYFQRYRRDFAILIVDVDHFLDIVKQHGQAAGDHSLRHIADVLDLSLRKTDKVSRFGGDEFIILLREISEADTIMLANRMRLAVESFAARYDNRVIPLTISIGAALIADSDVDVQGLIERADRALYAAKRAGRNCVRLHAPTDVMQEKCVARSRAA